MSLILRMVVHYFIYIFFSMIKCKKSQLSVSSVVLVSVSRCSLLWLMTLAFHCSVFLYSSNETSPQMFYELKKNDRVLNKKWLILWHAQKYNFLFNNQIYFCFSNLSYTTALMVLFISQQYPLSNLYTKIHRNKNKIIIDHNLKELIVNN